MSVVSLCTGLIAGAVGAVVAAAVELVVVTAVAAYAMTAMCGHYRAGRIYVAAAVVAVVVPEAGDLGLVEVR